MSTLAAPFDIGVKPGVEARLKLAAVKCYQGGAAAVVIGTGYATPLVVATSAMRFCGVFEETVDNSAGSAGAKWVRIRREGLAAWNSSGLTVANIGAPMYFSDDNTITATAGAVYAGPLVTIDENGVAWTDIGSAVQDTLFFNTTDDKIYSAGYGIKSVAMS